MSEDQCMLSLEEAKDLALNLEGFVIAFDRIFSRIAPGNASSVSWFSISLNGTYGVV